MITAPLIRTVFVSSTVYDLEKERQFVAKVLNSFDGPVRFRCLLSDAPDFPVTPVDIQERHSYEICVDKIATSDYFILLLGRRYGTPLILEQDNCISITHKEYRVAYDLRRPIFTFVDQQTWDARHSLKQNGEQQYVPHNHVKIFSFIDEILLKPRSNWFFMFASLREVEQVIGQVIFSFDDSVFEADASIPDGTVVEANQEFEKVWEIRNTGCVVWHDRFLREENKGASGLTATSSMVPIPVTYPGETARLSVTLKAPKYPGTCFSYWKMVDEHGKYCFPHKKGLFCQVKVVDSKCDKWRFRKPAPPT